MNFHRVPVGDHDHKPWYPSVRTYQDGQFQAGSVRSLPVGPRRWYRETTALPLGQWGPQELMLSHIYVKLLHEVNGGTWGCSIRNT